MSVSSSPSVDKVRPTSSMSIEELRNEYVALKAQEKMLLKKQSYYDGKMVSLTEESVALHQNAEIEEESATNRIVRKIDDVMSDIRKYNLLLDEEKKARETIRQKIKDENKKNTDLDNEIDEQEEYFLKDIQSKLIKVLEDKQELEQNIREEREKYLALLTEQLARIRANCEETSTTGGGGLTESTRSSQPPFSESIRTASSGTASTLEPPSRASYTANDHHAVVKAEHRLNQLLLDHAEATKEAEENQRRCTELSEKLKAVGQQAFLDRAQVVKMKEDLQETRAMWDNLESSMEGSTSQLITPNRSIDLTSHDRRDWEQRRGSSRKRLE